MWDDFYLENVEPKIRNSELHQARVHSFTKGVLIRLTQNIPMEVIKMADLMANEDMIGVLDNLLEQAEARAK